MLTYAGRASYLLDLLRRGGGLGWVLGTAETNRAFGELDLACRRGATVEVRVESDMRDGGAPNRGVR